MTPEQITLVQDSFAKVVPIKEAAGEMFYGRLFELERSRCLYRKPFYAGFTHKKTN